MAKKLIFGLLAALTAGAGHAAEAADWVVHNLRRDPPTAGGKAVAADGKSNLDIGCNGLLGKDIGATLNNYSGLALRRVNDESETVTLEVAMAGAQRTFTTRMHYYAPERAWVLTDRLPVDFLDAFSSGNALIIRNGSGREVVRFGLSGSANVGAKMREYCRI